MALGVSLGSEWMVIGFGMVLLSQKTKFEAHEIQRFLLCVPVTVYRNKCTGRKSINVQVVKAKGQEEWFSDSLYMVSGCF